MVTTEQVIKSIIVGEEWNGCIVPNYISTKCSLISQGKIISLNNNWWIVSQSGNEG